MQRLITLLLVAALGWYGYTKYQSHRAASLAAMQEERNSSSPSQPGSNSPSQVPAGFKCDGRIYCSEMTSCAEATYFLKNCPGVKMDGNNDGIPCEKQWCSQ